MFAIHCDMDIHVGYVYFDIYQLLNKLQYYKTISTVLFEHYMYKLKAKRKLQRSPATAKTLNAWHLDTQLIGKSQYQLVYRTFIIINALKIWIHCTLNLTTLHMVLACSQEFGDRNHGISSPSKNVDLILSFTMFGETISKDESYMSYQDSLIL